MATTINLPNGERRVFFNDDEIELKDLIKEKLGNDAADIYEHVLAERDELFEASMAFEGASA